MKHRLDLTKSSVPKTISVMTFNMIIGMLGMVLFNLVDTYFIGKLGTTPLASIGFTLPVIMFQGAISLGMGIGASSLISQAIGRKNNNDVLRFTTFALILAVIIAVFMCILGLLTINPVFRLLGADENQLELIREYMIIWYIGVPFVVIPMVGNHAIRAAGNTAIPSIIMLISVGVNVVLDPLFIFGAGPISALGLKGAALATVFSRAISLVAALYFLHHRFKMISLKILTLENMLISSKKIFYLGFPAALTQMLLPVTMSFVTRIVSSYGEEAVAALGVANRIEFFAMAPLMALYSVIIPFTGQNRGAMKIDRISQGIRFSSQFSMILGLLTFLVFLIFAKNIAGIFTSNPDVIKSVVYYMIIVSIGYGFQGVSGIGAAVFNALHKPLNSAGINAMRLIVLLIPLVLLGSWTYGLNGIFTGIMLSSVISGILTFFWLKKSINQILVSEIQSE
ncbi:MAG: MATE family efflux transporter [Deltaproteobacteria bacterium]|nr:MATE family efflux transporter [Deltaproteobacteria bacterium]